MVARVHHATVKKAEKLGFTIAGTAEDSYYTIRWPERNKTLVALDASQGVADMALLKMLAVEYPRINAQQDGYDWELYLGPIKTGDMIGSGKTLQEAWDEYIESNEAEGGDLGEGSEDGPADEEKEEPDEGKSVVKRKYKSAYRPFKQKCGDELSRLISDHLKVVDDETGEERIDPKRLVQFAKANDCWQASYADLNIGMRRMNVRNRLAAKIRRDKHEIVWG